MKRRESKPMVTLYFILLLLLPFGYAQAQTQEEEEELEQQELEERELSASIDQDHNRLFKIHPLQIGEVYVSYEKVRAKRISNEIGLSYVYSSGLNGDMWLPESKKTVGAAVRMSQRYYTSKKKQAPFGFFHGPMFGYKFLAFEKNVFGREELPQDDPNYKFVGRLYQNSLELNYQLGGQFMLSRHLTLEVAGGLGGRVKYARAVGGEEEMRNTITGHILTSDDNSVITALPTPHLKISVGFAY
ncbi:ABC transporter ATP-binding protein [Pontibacter vulgaris]|uniref:ABC transporter ATP-binding protein n=1 Tax=Pontibacter vulgaris TaxID=2905679 RepID=UPI001FA7822D|nr:ABC transporter ATP-binding protein [Pontibacter vulgaris]